MIFTVNFKLPNKNSLHIHNMTNNIGMELVELIHEELGFKVAAKQLFVFHECPAFNNSIYHINISDENIINKIPQFRTREKIQVTVPDGFLGKFWDMQINRSNTITNYSTLRFILSGFSKKLMNYDIRFAMNDNEIIKEWIKAGCPEKWNVNENTIVHHPDYTFWVMLTACNKHETKVQFKNNIHGTNIKEAVLTSKEFAEEQYIGPSAVIRESDAYSVAHGIINRLSNNDLVYLKDKIENTIEKNNE